MFEYFGGLCLETPGGVSSPFSALSLYDPPEHVECVACKCNPSGFIELLLLISYLCASPPTFKNRHANGEKKG